METVDGFPFALPKVDCLCCAADVYLENLTTYPLSGNHRHTADGSAVSAFSINRSWLNVMIAQVPLFTCVPKQPRQRTSIGGVQHVRGIEYHAVVDAA